MKSTIEKLKTKKHLEAPEIKEVMRAIMSGVAPKEDIASFLLALREKGPTIEEITSAAEIMRQFSLKVKTTHQNFLDTCGTGGDRAGTFNISTVVAFVVAGAGAIVAKHGNRSVSSKCGSADVLEALGVNLELTPEQLGKCLDQVGIAFLFAQKLHPAMKHAASVRKELGVETIFNLLGPLTNPAGATHQMMGVYDSKMVEPLAFVLKNLGLKRAMVVHGSDGLDEITTTGASYISEYNGVKVLSYSFSPVEYNIPLSRSADLKGGNLEENVGIVKDILGGKLGPKRDLVILNAAFALYVAEKAADIFEGIALSKNSIDSGNALAKLEELKKFTQAPK